MKGYVYVLVNDAMPGLVKVGRSKNSLGRAKALYCGNTGVPLPFYVHFECMFDNCVEGEAAVHADLIKDRINRGREFFSTDPDDAAIAVIRARAGCHDYIVEYGDIFERIEIGVS